MSRPIFVIYSPDDRDLAELVAAALTSIGATPDMEWELDNGGRWSDEMDQALDEAGGCVLVIGPAGLGTAGSLEMRLCLARQSARGAPVVAILLPGTDPRDIPLFLQGHPQLTMNHDQDFSALPRLLRDCFGQRQARVSAQT